MRLRLVAGLAAVVLGLLGSARSGATLPNPPTTRLGQGADEVWLFWPSRSPTSIVVFGHGWSTPFPRAFMPWIDHLRAGGSVVVYPRYELTTASSETTALAALQDGIVTAFARLRSLRVPVVAVGKSFAGGEIFEYAVNAARWRVPPPAAVLSIFPAAPFNGTPTRTLPERIYVEILVGDRDTTVGSSGAEVLWHWLAAHPNTEKRYVVVRSHPGFVANHDSASLASAGARAAFWRPLDLLLARARAAG